MGKHNFQDMLDTLESLIDDQGLTNVLAAMQCVVDSKVEHIQCNWQDKNLAKDWQRASNAIYTAAHKAQELKL